MGLDSSPGTHEVDRVAAYWDQNREKSRDPAYWMAHPEWRKAINRRVSGNVHEWPLDWLKRTRVAAPFHRGGSWGCGLGAFERSAIRCGIADAIDAFDVSGQSLDDARKEADREGIRGIHYRLGDFNDPKAEGPPYDVVFFHQSLHHVRRLEVLFRRLREGIAAPGAAVYVDEYVGPSRSQWTEAKLAAGQRFLDSLPAIAKIETRIALPIQHDDPSEAIRSGELTGFLGENVEILEWRPYGGQLASLVFPCLSKQWTDSPEALESVARMVREEEEQLERDPSSTFYLVAYGRLREKPAPVSLSNRADRLFRRLRARFGP